MKNSNIDELLDTVKGNIEKGKYIPFNSIESKSLRDYYKSKLIIPTGYCDKYIFNKCGTEIGTEYERIVIGDYGAYVEIKYENLSKLKIHTRPDQRFRETLQYKDRVKYYWLETKDKCKTKIYYQQRTVRYADYLPGMCYVSPDDIILKEGRL